MPDIYVTKLSPLYCRWIETAKRSVLPPPFTPSLKQDNVQLYGELQVGRYKAAVTNAFHNYEYSPARGTSTEGDL